MAYAVKILADSLAPNGKRLTTFEATYPRFAHSELLTHRLFSRNSASSRAIPTSKIIEQVEADPVMPVWWGRNQAGMQARMELTGNDLQDAEIAWLRGRDSAVEHAHTLMEIGAHKQIVNRILEPWMWITTIISATEWDNFWYLRCHPDAQPELRHVAEMMREAYIAHEPTIITPQDAIPWHLPLVSIDDLGYWAVGELSVQDLVKVSVGRCARVSYLTHSGERDLQADIALHDRLAQSGHWSPFEHVAQAIGPLEPSGNFVGWQQYRKTFAREHFGGERP